MCGYEKGGKKGFEGVITRLQMQTYICVSDFVYEKDKQGKPYGWGVAEYAAAESLLGADVARGAYRFKPEKSYELIFEHLRKLLPAASENQLEKFIGK